MKMNLLDCPYWKPSSHHLAFQMQIWNKYLVHSSKAVENYGTGEKKNHIFFKSETYLLRKN